MRIARKLTLLATMTFTAMAVAVPSAFAQETEPELHNQAPRLIAGQEVHFGVDFACPAVTPTPPVADSPTVTSGGCRAHVASAGTVMLGAHLTSGVEVVLSECTMEFDIRIDAAGEGWMSHQEIGSPAGCSRRPCGQLDPPTGEGRAWSFHMSEVEPPASAGTEQIVFLICTEHIDDGSVPFHCEHTLPISQSTLHRYRFVANDTPSHHPASSTWPSCELTGTFDVEVAAGSSGEGQARQNLEIRHS
jgi:hypothetical protein